MRSIGIRVKPKEIYFSIVEGDDNKFSIISIDKLILPISLSVPDKLNFIRKTLIDIINLNKVDAAGIKITEGNARTISIERVSIEAVIQELFSSCSVKKYFVGNIARLSKLLNYPNDGTIKKVITKEEIPEEFNSLEELHEFHIESTLSAIAALSL